MTGEHGKGSWLRRRRRRRGLQIILIQPAPDHPIIQLPSLISFFAEEAFKFFVRGDYITGVVFRRRENLSHHFIELLGFLELKEAFAIWWVADGYGSVLWLEAPDIRFRGFDIVPHSSEL